MDGDNSNSIQYDNKNSKPIIIVKIPICKSIIDLITIS